MSSVRRALLVGINYEDHEMPTIKLNGCHSDVDAAYNMLTRVAGFSPNEVVLLVDDQKTRARGDTMPTRANILKQLKVALSSVANASSGVFYFHFSGHGTLKPRQSDPRDSEESLCPYDLRANGNAPGGFENLISNTELLDVVNSFSFDINKHALTFVFDCCHSGSRSLGLKSRNLADNIPRSRSADLAVTAASVPNGQIFRFLQPESSTDLAPTVCFCACSKKQTAGDGKSGGVFSEAFYPTLEKKSLSITNEELQIIVKKMIEYTQSPQLVPFNDRLAASFFLTPPGSPPYSANGGSTRDTNSIPFPRRSFGQRENEVRVTGTGNRDYGGRDLGSHSSDLLVEYRGRDTGNGNRDYGGRDYGNRGRDYGGRDLGSYSSDLLVEYGGRDTGNRDYGGRDYGSRDRDYGGRDTGNGNRDYGGRDYGGRDRNYGGRDVDGKSSRENIAAPIRAIAAPTIKYNAGDEYRVLNKQRGSEVVTPGVEAARAALSEFVPSRDADDKSLRDIIGTSLDAVKSAVEQVVGDKVPRETRRAIADEAARQVLNSFSDSALEDIVVETATQTVIDAAGEEGNHVDQRQVEDLVHTEARGFFTDFIKFGVPIVTQVASSVLSSPQQQRALVEDRGLFDIIGSVVGTVVNTVGQVFGNRGLEDPDNQKRAIDACRIAIQNVQKNRDSSASLANTVQTAAIDAVNQTFANQTPIKQIEPRFLGALLPIGIDLVSSLLFSRDLAQEEQVPRGITDIFKNVLSVAANTAMQFLNNTQQRRSLDLDDDSKKVLVVKSVMETSKRLARTLAENPAVPLWPKDYSRLISETVTEVVKTHGSARSLNDIDATTVRETCESYNRGLLDSLLPIGINLAQNVIGGLLKSTRSLDASDTIDLKDLGTPAAAITAQTIQTMALKGARISEADAQRAAEVAATRVVERAKRDFSTPVEDIIKQEATDAALDATRNVCNEEEVKDVADQTSRGLLDTLLPMGAKIASDVLGGLLSNRRDVPPANISSLVKPAARLAAEGAIKIARDQGASERGIFDAAWNAVKKTASAAANLAGTVISNNQDKIVELASTGIQAVMSNVIGKRALGADVEATTRGLFDSLLSVGAKLIPGIVGGVADIVGGLVTNKRDITPESIPAQTLVEFMPTLSQRGFLDLLGPAVNIATTVASQLFGKKRGIWDSIKNFGKGVGHLMFTILKKYLKRVAVNFITKAANNFGVTIDPILLKTTFETVIEALYQKITPIVVNTYNKLTGSNNRDVQSSPKLALPESSVTRVITEVGSITAGALKDAPVSAEIKRDAIARAMNQAAESLTPDSLRLLVKNSLSKTIQDNVLHIRDAQEPRALQRSIEDELHARLPL